MGASVIASRPTTFVFFLIVFIARSQSSDVDKEQHWRGKPQLQRGGRRNRDAAKKDGGQAQAKKIPYLSHIEASRRASQVIDERRKQRPGGNSAAELMYAKGKCNWKLCSGAQISQAQLDFLKGAFNQKAIRDIMNEYLDWSMTEIKAAKRGEWPMNTDTRKCAMIECPDRQIIGSIKDLGSDPAAISQMLPEVNMRRILENMRVEEQEEETRSPERSERSMKMAERVEQGFRDKANIADFRQKMRPQAAPEKGAVVEIEANVGEGSSHSGMLYQV